MRVLWVRSRDVIEIRFLDRRPAPERVTRADVLAHIADYRLLGVTLSDTKRLRLGALLRAGRPPLNVAPGDPLPAGTILYDEAARTAYISLWPNLTGGQEQRVARNARLLLDGQGRLARIRIPVAGPKGEEDALGPAAGLLPRR